MHEIDFKELLVDTADLISIVTDAQTYELLYMNKDALRSYGIHDEQDYQGKPCYEVLQGLDHPCEGCPIPRMTEGEAYRWEQFNRRTGCWHDNRDHIVTRAGRKLYMKSARDITARKEGRLSHSSTMTMEDTLFRCLHIMATEKDFHVAVQQFLEAVGCYYDADRCYIVESDLTHQNLRNTFEWRGDGVFAEKNHPHHLPPELAQDWLDKFAHDGEFFISAAGAGIHPDTKEYRILAARRTECLMAAPFQREDGTFIGFFGIDHPGRQTGNMLLLRTAAACIQAELEKRHMQEELEHLNHADVLTGAYNRRQYNRYLMSRSPNEAGSLGAVVASINGLKDINAQCGTHYGDRIICKVCDIMRENLSGQIFRVSGDEFVMFSEDITENAFLSQVSAFRRCLQPEENCSVSIGCAWKSSEVLAEKLVEQAQELMYAEKRSYYSTILKHGDHIRHTSAAEEVLHEIENNRFVAFFQPQIDFTKGKIAGAEALVRKLDADGNLIYPDKFIPFYEAAGLIRYVDLHMLDLACQALRAWLDDGLDLKIAVNFSRRTLMEPEIMDEILRICRKHGVSPHKITIEVTENISDMEETQLQGLMVQMKENQFQVSLDDFGTSYSNLSILSSIEFDEVKFDRSLIRDIEHNRKSQVVVRNGLKMCHELGGAVSVAEGIETKKQMEFLVQYGCYVGQGYYFSKPVSRAAFTDLLKKEPTFGDFPS